jgi:hypothetical protein
MTMSCKYRFRFEENINIDNIQSKKDEYSLDYRELTDNDIPYEGIKRYSFLFPPIFVEKNSYLCTVIGKLFVDIYQRLKLNIPYGLIIEKKGSDYEFFKYLIYLKQAVNGFNIIEKAISVKKLYDLSGRFDTEVLPVLDVPENEKIIRNFLLLAEAPKKIKMLILQGRIHEATAFEVFKFKKANWEFLGSFVAGLFLGTKKRNQLLNMIHDIVIRDQINVRHILGSKELQQLRGLKIDPPQIGERIYTAIEKMRYPVIQQYRREFFRKLKEVGIRKEFRLEIPKDFEEWKFQLVLPFSSLDDFKENLKHLIEIGEKESFNELMKLRTMDGKR